MNWTLLTNSLLVAGAATLLAAALGLAVALMLATTQRVVRTGLLTLCVAVLALPSFLVANSWIDLLGVNGALRRWLPLDIFSLPGAVWILALLLWPVSALGIFSAWQKLDAAHLELDPGLRGTNLLRFLLLPAAKGPLVISAVITFALALNNFAVPAILQVKVFPAEVWVQFNTSLDAMAAFRLSWPLILGPVLLIFFLRREAIPWPRESASDIDVQLSQQLGPLWLGVSRAVGALALGLTLFVPLAQIVFHARTWSEFLPALAAGQAALWHSLFYAATAAVVTVAVGALLMRVRGLGWLWIFFLVPGVLLGVGALTTFNHPALFWFSRTSAIVIALLVVRYLSVAHSLTRSAHQSLDQNLIDAARVNGAAGFALFRHAVLPQMAGPLAGAGYVVFVLSLWDVETTLLVLPPGGETLAVRIFNLLHYGHNSQVNALCLILLLAALVPLVAWSLIAAVRRRGT
jgi:iron(III) transport system permease protein